MRWACLIAAAAGAACSSGALGQQYNPANRHLYRLTPAPMSWPEAHALAAGCGGHLAAVNDGAEAQWILAHVPTGAELLVWIGGRDQGIPQWVWVTGEPFTYAPWAHGPYSAPQETFAALYVAGSERGGFANSTGGQALHAVIEIGEGCYANCDASCAAPNLNVADFSCFLQRFAAGEEYANCDRSTALPALNVADFSCFLTRYAQGCP